MEKTKGYTAYQIEHLINSYNALSKPGYKVNISVINCLIEIAEDDEGCSIQYLEIPRHKTISGNSEKVYIVDPEKAKLIDDKINNRQ